MSDDDCDIFKIVSKRGPVQVVSNQQYNMANDSLSQESDYDFIESQDTSKKPVKGARANAARKPKEKAVKNVKEALKNKADELKGLEPTGNVLPTRSLSPVSQLILEMEQKHTEEQRDNVPVARRTRSSLGKADSTSKIQESAELPVVPPPKPRGRGRKAKKTPMAVEDTVPYGSRQATRSQASAIAPEVVDLNIGQYVRHGNRRQVAEFAARSKVLDSIDLVSAVMPRVEGFVNLDSDEEAPSNTMKPMETEVGSNMDNYLIEISLNWLGEMQTYKLRQFQKFSSMFEEIAKRNNVDVNDVEINMDYHFIKPYESPYKIGLKNFHILSGRAIKSNDNNNKGGGMADDYNLMALTRKPKKFQLKVQTDKMKRPLIIPIKKKETFSILYIQCAEELNCDVKDIQLFFDGDLLDPEDTPLNQDMEGNEMIDMRLKT